MKVVEEDNGKQIEMIGYWADITERKQAEELLACFPQRDSPPRKKNLPIISSLLRLQSRKIQDKEALQSFIESQNRVQIRALVHEQLYQSENLADLGGEHVENLGHSQARPHL